MPQTDSGDINAERFLKIRAVADELGISERSVWRLLVDDEQPTHRFGSPTRIKRSDLEAAVRAFCACCEEDPTDGEEFAIAIT